MGRISRLCDCFGRNRDDGEGTPLDPVGPPPRLLAPPRPVTPVPSKIDGLQLVTGKDPEGFGIDFIAVHGLGGHPTNTWTDPKTHYYWLKDLTAQLGVASTARVFTFGYNGNLMFGRSVSTVLDFAISLLGGLRRERHSVELKGRPIIFICHSLGGIVVKRALSMARGNPLYAEVYHSVSGVVFMGTPYQGSDAATTVAMLTNILQITPLRGLINDRLIQSLRADCDVLMELSEGFRHETIRVITFYESRQTRGVTVLVPRSSALLNDPGEIQVPCDTDHHGICKFPSESDNRFKELVQELGMLAESVMEQDPFLKVCEQDHDFLRNLGKKHNFDPPKQLQDVLERKCQSTGLWIHEHETFKTWKNSTTHASLWLTGGPGSGKTVMTASIVEKLRGEYTASSRPLILYYSVDGKETAKSNHLNLLPGLIHQILLAKPKLIGEVRRVTKMDEYFSSTLEKSFKIIRTMIKDIPEIFLMVDAIDECKVLEPLRTKDEEDKQKARLLHLLIDLQNYTKCLKLLVSSRTDTNSLIGRVFDEYNTPTICLTLNHVAADIKMYLRVQLREFDLMRRENDQNRTKEKAIKQRIIDTILTDSAGMFLYAFMAWTTFRYWGDTWDDRGLEKRFEMLKILAGEKGMEDMKEIAGTTTIEPVTLSAFYLNILNMLPNTERSQKRTKKLFQWLVTAHTPLTLAELRDAFMLELDDKSKAGMGSAMDIREFKRVLRESCGALITITASSQTVRLYHQSIREFFLENNHRFSFTRAEAELHSSTACLTYLSFTDLVETLPRTRSEQEIYGDDAQLLTDFPLLKYAALYWHYHIPRAEMNPFLWELFVSWANSDNLRVCCRIYWNFKGTGDFPRDASPMHILSYLGLQSFVEMALAENGPPAWASMVNTCDSLKRTPLHWAAVNGHNGLVQLLLDNGANAEQMDSRGLTPLELALEFGSRDAVSSLMGERRIRDQWLELTVVGGRAVVVQLLLERGADANFVSPNTSYGSPLHAAAYQGDEKIVHMLLKAGADVNRFSDKFGTALQLATYHREPHIVKILLDYGADVNIMAGHHGTALQAAAHRGQVDIVQELLIRGADVNAPVGNSGETAIDLAKRAGWGDVVELLATAGAHANGPLVERPQSLMDPVLRHTLDLHIPAIVRGNQTFLMRQLEIFKSELQDAILSGDERKVRWILRISIPYFRIAVKRGHESFVETLVSLGLTTIQDAVKSPNSKVLSLITVAWTKALITAYNDGKGSLVERTLQGCVKDYKALVDDGKILDAKNILSAGLEIFFEACRVGDQPFIEMVANVWVVGNNDVMKGPYRDSLFETVGIYTGKWVGAIRRKDINGVRVLGKAWLELLLAAAGAGNALETSKQATAFFVLTLRRVLDSRDPNMRNWVLHEAKPFARNVIGRKDVKLAEAYVKVGMELFLAIRQPSTESDYAQLEDIVLGIGTTLLGEIAQSGLMESAETSFRNLAAEKFDMFDRGSPREGQLHLLKSSLFWILESVSQAGSRIPSMQKTVDDLKIAIEGFAEDATFVLP